MAVRRAFSSVSCAYSSFGMVKLSRSIFTFSGLAFLVSFLAVFLILSFVALALTLAAGFATVFLTGLVIASVAGLATGLAAGLMIGLAATELATLGFKPSASACIGEIFDMTQLL